MQKIFQILLVMLFLVACDKGQKFRGASDIDSLNYHLRLAGQMSDDTSLYGSIASLLMSKGSAGSDVFYFKVSWLGNLELDMKSYNVYIQAAIDTTLRSIEWKYTGSIVHIAPDSMHSIDGNIPMPMWVRAGVSAIDISGNDSDMSISRWEYIDRAINPGLPEDHIAPRMPRNVRVENIK